MQCLSFREGSHAKLCADLRSKFSAPARLAFCLRPEGARSAAKLIGSSKVCSARVVALHFGRCYSCSRARTVSFSSNYVRNSISGQSGEHQEACNVSRCSVLTLA